MYLQNLLQLLLVFNNNDIDFTVLGNEVDSIRSVGGVHTNSKATGKKTGLTLQTIMVKSKNYLLPNANIVSRLFKENHISPPKRK